MGNATAARENGKLGGRPKGSKSVKTLEKEKIVAALQQRYLRAANQIANAQIGLALGSQYLYKIEKEKIVGPKGGITYRSKKPELVTAQWEIEQFLEGECEEGDPRDEHSREATYYFLTAKSPENNAIEAIQNRAYGKPKETVELTGVKKLLVDF